MSKHLTLFWVVPASALLLPLALLVMIAALPPSAYSLAYFIRDIYEVLFWITPAVGVAVLLSFQTASRSLGTIIFGQHYEFLTVPCDSVATSAISRQMFLFLPWLTLILCLSSMYRPMSNLKIDIL